MLVDILRSVPGLTQACDWASRFMNERESGVSSNDHWARVVMNRETERLIRSIRPERISALEFQKKCLGKMDEVSRQ
jgi:hypothetical protein